MYNEKSFIEILKIRADELSNKIALIKEETSYKYTFKELYTGIILFANALKLCNIKPNDKIALFANNHPRFVVCDQGIILNQAVCVCANSTMPMSELKHIYTNSDSCALITDSIEVIQAFTSDNNLSLNFIIYISENSNSENLDSISPQVLTYEDMIKRGEELGVDREYKINPNNPAIIVYTSGTSGQSKGVVLSNKNLFSQIDYFLSNKYNLNIDLYITCLQIAHSAPRAFAYKFLAAGITTMFVEYSAFIDACKKYKPDAAHFVPKMTYLVQQELLNYVDSWGVITKKIYNFCYKNSLTYYKLKHSKSHNILYPYYFSMNFIGKLLFYNKMKLSLFSNKFYVSTGAAAVDNKTQDFFEILGCPLLPTYGLTETSPTITTSNLQTYKKYTVGQPIYNVQIKIINPETKEELPIGQTGLICVKGPQVMMGYYNNEEQTKKIIMPDGFLQTGDVGYLSKDNYLTFVGRLKELIVLANGKNIAPIPLENICKENSLIEQIMIFGQDKMFLTALVYLNKNNKQIFSKEQILEIINNSIKSRESFQWSDIIRDITILDNPIVSSTDLQPNLGKIRRNDIYKKYKNLIEAMYNVKIENK